MPTSRSNVHFNFQSLSLSSFPAPDYFTTPPSKNSPNPLHAPPYAHPMEHTDCKAAQPSNSYLEAPPEVSTLLFLENFEVKKDGFEPGTEHPEQKPIVSGSIGESEPKAASMDIALSVDGTPTHSAGSAPSASLGLFPSTVSLREKMENVRSMLGRWGISVMCAAKKAEILAGSTWQHLKTSPSFADAAMGRIAHSTKVLAEGGYENIFRQTFETTADEMLKSSYACYLSTSAGPVMGALYVSTAKLAFCSDTALPYTNGDKTEWSYYKLIIPLHELKAVYPSTSKTNPAEKFIQIVSIDNHEFWYMGFLNYEGAVSTVQEALLVKTLQSV